MPASLRDLGKWGGRDLELKPQALCLRPFGAFWTQALHVIHYNFAMSLPKEIPLPQWEGAFEALMLRLFREVWNDPSAQLIGRRGQEQAGVDVHGEDRARDTGSVGVQCKLHGS